MRIYDIHSHRFAETLVSHVPELNLIWSELIDAIEGISDEALVAEFVGEGTEGELKHWSDGRPVGSAMSLSVAINSLLRKALIPMGWHGESGIFQDPAYNKIRETRWRLDFSKVMDRVNLESGKIIGDTGIAVEVAFNHGEAIAWNLLKPVMASELNHVEKQLDLGEGVGVIICASKALKDAGGFDRVVGEYEKFIRYLKPMRNQLTVPLLLVGLDAPETFKIEKKKVKKNEWGRETIGIVTPI